MCFLSTPLGLNLAEHVCVCGVNACNILREFSWDYFCSFVRFSLVAIYMDAKIDDMGTNLRVVTYFTVR